MFQGLKRLSTAAAVVAMVISPFQSIAQAGTFFDVSVSNEFYSYIEELVAKGAISGQSGLFRPDDSLTRAELTKMVVLAGNIPLDSGGTPTFTDVPTSHTLYAYVETAARAGIVGGFGGGLFRPNEPVTRGQATKIIHKAYQLNSNTTGGPHFSDVNVSNSFYIYVETMFNEGIISGYNPTYFGVNDKVTRAQSAKIIIRTDNHVNGVNDDTVEDDMGESFGLTSKYTSDCIKDRTVTNRDDSNNMYVQMYTSGRQGNKNNPVGIVVKVTDSDGRPVPQMQLRMEVTEGPGGSVSYPQEIGRSGVYLGTYTADSNSTYNSQKVTLLVYEEDNSSTSRPDGYEDVLEFPPTMIDFDLLQTSVVGTPTKICWDLTREDITVDQDYNSYGLDDMIVVIGVVEDGNGVGVGSGVNLQLYSTGDSAGTLSASQYSGGVYAFRFQPSNYNSNNSVVVNRTHYLTLQLVTNFRVFSSDQMKAIFTYLPRD